MVLSLVLTSFNLQQGRPVDHGRSASVDINYGLRQNTLMPPVRLGPPPRHPPPCWGPWLNGQHNTHSLPQRGRPMTQPSPPQISHTVSSANDFQRGSTSVPVARPPPLPAKELLPSQAAPPTESKGPGLFSVFEDRQNSQHQQMYAAAQSIAAANSMEVRSPSKPLLSQFSCHYLHNVNSTVIFINTISEPLFECAYLPLFKFSIGSCWVRA